MPTTHTLSLPTLTREQALALPTGARVRDPQRGCEGVVDAPGLFGELVVKWTTNCYYDKRLRDYIGSTTWDLLDLDHYDSPVALEVLS